MRAWRRDCYSRGLRRPLFGYKPEETPLLARELAVNSHFQTRSINRSPEAALRVNNIPSPFPGEDQAGTAVPQRTVNPLSPGGRWSGQNGSWLLGRSVQRSMFNVKKGQNGIAASLKLPARWYHYSRSPCGRGSGRGGWDDTTRLPRLTTVYSGISLHRCSSL